MTCKFDKEKIYSYMDGELNEEGMRETEAHLKTCLECRALHDELTAVKDMLSGAPELDLPEGYEQDLHDRLTAATGAVKRQAFNWKRWSAVAAVFMVAFLSYNFLKADVFRIGGAKNEMAVYDMAVMEEPAAMAPEFGAKPMEEQSVKRSGIAADSMEAESVGGGANLEGRKIIKNGYVNLEVENFEEIFDRIVTLTEASGGFIENSSTGKRYYGDPKNEITLLNGYLNLRIPEASFMEVYNQIKEMGEISDSGIGGSDITFQYNDISSQIENLEVQEARLREIMEKAEKVEELLQVERELNRVRTEIDRMTGMIKNWDNLVSYSTLDVHLTEVAPKSTEIEGFNDDFWERAKKGFIKSINQVIVLAQAIFVWSIAVIPFVLAIGIIGILVAWIVRMARRKRKK